MLARQHLIGLAYSIALGTVCYLAAQFLSGVSPLLLALVLGVILGNVRLVPRTVAPGLAWSTKKLLRAGVVLLGLQLSFAQIAALGWQTATIVVTTTTVTFAATILIGRLLRISRATSILIAAGVSICGASAIAAMGQVVDRDAKAEAATAQAVGIITLYGSLMIVLLPLAQIPLGLDDSTMGVWIGASVHEVAQVAAAAGVISAPAVIVAVAVKLGRVILLAPMIPLTSLALHTRPQTAGERRPRPPLLPLFVAGFLAAVLIRSTLPLPGEFVAGAGAASTLLLTIAMLGLGTGVRLIEMFRSGGRATALGAIATTLAVGISLTGVLVLAP